MAGSPIGGSNHDNGQRKREGMLLTTLHDSAFEYIKPTDDQINTMAAVRAASKAYSDALEQLLPNGPDKTFAMRNHRTTAMWANIAITRQGDGSPRT